MSMTGVPPVREVRFQEMVTGVPGRTSLASAERSKRKVRTRTVCETVRLLPSAEFRVNV